MSDDDKTDDQPIRPTPIPPAPSGMPRKQQADSSTQVAPPRKEMPSIGDVLKAMEEAAKPKYRVPRLDENTKETLEAMQGNNAGNRPPNEPPADATSGEEANGDEPLPKAGSPATIFIDSGMRNMIIDARELLEFALSGALRDRVGGIDEKILNQIVQVAYPYSQTDFLERQKWIDFLIAYDELCVFTSPVTASTLRDTRADDKGEESESSKRKKPPFQVTQFLWSATLGLVATAVLINLVEEGLGNASRDVDIAGLFELSSLLLQILKPFVYGGLGACTYLLRRANTLIAARAFTADFQSEYRIRIMLGIVSGGGAMLFLPYMGVSDDVGAKLSQAAICFLAGYSTDLLFRTLERLLEALFPRTNPPPKS